MRRTACITASCGDNLRLQCWRSDERVDCCNENLPDLLVNEGKYILIRHEEISGPFETYDDALEAGYGKYGVVPSS